MTVEVVNVIFNDAHAKKINFYKVYEDEYRVENTQQLDIVPSFHPSPVKSTTAVLQTLRNTMHSGSLSSSSTPSSQSSKVCKYFKTTWVEMTEVDFDFL